MPDERLADPASYADSTLVRDLVARHNAALDRIPDLEADERRLVAELEAAEARRGRMSRPPNLPEVRSGRR